MEMIFDPDKVSAKRHSKKLTQEEIARRAGLSLSCIISLENGRREPKAATLAKIARVLQTKMEYFFKHSA